MSKLKIRYCTYFNRAYLLKGLALSASLLRHDPSAKLDVLCMDKYSQDILDKLAIPGVTTISLADFEDSALKKAKSNRSLVEYFWTCTPSLPRYVLAHHPDLDLVSYLDADLYFYSSPQAIIQELGDESIYLVEHRYPQDQQYRDNISGRFNVAVQIWRNDREGRACINWWRQKCNEWCYLKEEPGRFGDQLYLNEWPKRYNRVRISANLGINTAPWNVAQYQVTQKHREVYINSDRLVVYHFHQLEYFNPSNYEYAHGYQFDPSTIKHIYQPYLHELNTQFKRVRSLDPTFKLLAQPKPLSAILRSKISKYLGPLYWHLRGLWQKNP